VSIPEKAFNAECAENDRRGRREVTDSERSRAYNSESKR
jgi:hypothetical protein